ncbi:MAG TPA: hypothetical protein PKL15_21380, partial [Saprospiraceae bacterium]|nr:hypothetical protein [Saprospiraceae bacterium]
PSMRIDTVFLHAEKMNDGELVVTLTASGRETDSTYTSVNFKMQRPVVGKPITWVPAEPRWCLGTGCTACWTFPTQCICNSNGEVNNPSCSTMPIVVSGGGTRPLDISDIIIPYLATE